MQSEGVQQTAPMVEPVNAAASRAVRHALWVALAPSMWLLATTADEGFGMDSAHAYWNVWRLGPYEREPGQQDAFNYSPAFAQLLYPLTLLPWYAFLGVWCALLTAALLWLLRPLASKWRWVILFYVTPTALIIGNIEVFLAVAAAIGFSRPEAWAFPLLTKVTPGLGPVWFIARAEWGRAIRACLTTTLVVTVSFMVAPELWFEWVDYLLRATVPPTQVDYPPLWLRLALALAIVGWGARRDRRWALVVAMILAMPLWSGGILLLLTALPRMNATSGGAAEASTDPSSTSANKNSAESEP